MPYKIRLSLYIIYDFNLLVYILITIVLSISNGI
jgi:hypothetical protein